jgi:hypothetical protein
MTYTLVWRNEGSTGAGGRERAGRLRGTAGTLAG